VAFKEAFTMAVIINDFEIMVEPPTSTGPDQSAGAVSASEPMPPMTLRPEDVERIIGHFEQRRSRLTAD